MCSEERCARKELYEVPGGILVDGLPPVPSFGIDELEEFRRGVELVGRPGQKGQCGNFWVVLLRLERYLTIHFEEPDFSHL
eukprot:2986136-Pyramimonas_sp.AAC.1